ncbi:MAG TPA: ADP-ribosylation factor-like protein [Candidatus Mcinerneyibacteriales bacterium]|jgi:signal recognition particle receptor subunit beta|nr:gliding-motility protein MglA [Candidatus Mcinerneyibacteriota bacterium]HHH84657.1 gliding-motility protein MglA [Bacillota bacterium]HPE20019.1 ADP-ribosylation factor-like protein [Candidatus Mcinerneyibacteriales bacterium]HPJ70004.1 ADP-ribosylation factor-like protein [Candidatus Mcinerneyibacteriales bacterium]HPQ88867.1 ADP-ribosylation factor-like protein [Candidatus Mcinerneyibacteriales bacterium]
MSLINYASREINCKIVYYGPGLGGKTTNIKYVYKQIDPSARGKLVSLATEADRTLFFDFLPLDLGQVQGFKTRFHLYTVPGQVHYDASRRLILKGADGVVFVADAQRERLEQNIESLENLRVNLISQNLDPETIPFVMQYNKMDLANVMSSEELEQQLNPKGYLSFEAIAVEGIGVFDTLKAISKLVLKAISEGR